MPVEVLLFDSSHDPSRQQPYVGEDVVAAM
jgi:hypothetical protein